jgi:nucleotide-binding universal stress UspA family protein
VPEPDHFDHWEPPRSVVVLHDLSTQAGHAAWRAGLVARDHGARLELLHAGCRPGPAGDPRTTLERLAGELAARLGVDAQVRVVNGEPLQAVIGASRSAGLLVVGAQRGNVLRDWVFGTPAERLIRLCARPVLVVKNPATSGYRRVLVPVDLGPATTEAIAAAAALSRSMGIEVFHSLRHHHEVTLRAADLPEAEVRRLRQRTADRARAAIDALIGKVPGASNTALPSIGFGHPPGVVLAKAKAMRAELIVIGKRRRSILADFLLGSVTQRVLASSRSDVLVLPAVMKAIPAA